MKVLAFLIGLCLFAEVALAQDKCLPILTNAARDNYNFEYTNNLSFSAKKFFCDEQFSAYRGKNGQSFGLTVPIYGVPVHFGMDSSDEKAGEFRRKFCQDTSATFDERTSMRIVQSIVRRDALDAFVECRRIDVGNVPGLTLNTRSLSDKNFTAKLLWKRIRPGEPVPRIKQVLVTGAACTGTLRVNSPVPEGSGASATCTRSGTGAVSLIVSTEFDSVDTYLPPTSALGQCHVAVVTDVVQWNPTGECRVAAALTDQLHGQPERPYSIHVTVEEGKRLTGVCAALSCEPRPGFQNGCRFGREVQHVPHSERYFETRLMVGSHPQIWRKGFAVEKSSTTQVERRLPTPITLYVDRVFSVDAAPNEKLVLHCSMQRNLITFDPASENPPSPFKRVGVSDTPNRKIYQFDVSP